MHVHNFELQGQSIANEWEKSLGFADDVGKTLAMRLIYQGFEFMKLIFDAPDNALASQLSALCFYILTYIHYSDTSSTLLLPVPPQTEDTSIKSPEPAWDSWDKLQCADFILEYIDHCLGRQEWELALSLIDKQEQVDSDPEVAPRFFYIRAIALAGLGRGKEAKTVVLTSYLPFVKNIGVDTIRWKDKERVRLLAGRGLWPVEVDEEAREILDAALSRDTSLDP